MATRNSEGARGLAARHENLRIHFGDSGVSRERLRYVRGVTARYRQELIRRFLTRHATRVDGSCLEVGPGPGRFSRLLIEQYPSLCFLDLSRPMLMACRRGLPRLGLGGSRNFIEGSLEAMPLRDRSFDRIVALGVLPFVAREFPRTLRGLARLLKPRGKLIFEIQSPSQTTMTVLSPNPAGARTILRCPKEFHLWSLVRRGYQPHDPKHWGRFEVIWRRPAELKKDVAASGLRIVDVMAIAPNFGNQPEFLRSIRRDSAAFATALELEEETGRWPELLGAGARTLVAAVLVHRRIRRQKT
ncbi:MAG TPA: class I SAM-dependent methyltransferase [Thermoplasmata archaeon]|nr:class I SAM-dependent methyltransferase [Thermoplasmata archaeon]